MNTQPTEPRAIVCDDPPEGLASKEYIEWVNSLVEAERERIRETLAAK